MAGDASAVPTQQRLGRHDPATAESAGERGGDGAEQVSVVIGEFGPVDLSSQHLELVAKHDDLEVLGVARAHGEAC